MTKTATTKTLKRIRVVPAPVETTVTTEDYYREAGVVLMGSNFQIQFLGLEIGATVVAELVIDELTIGLLDEEIFTELGGRDKAEISVKEFKTFLAMSRKSPEWFVFYLKGRDGNLWAVNADWLVDSGGWRVGARSMAAPDGWRAGSQVVSRN